MVSTDLALEGIYIHEKLFGFAPTEELLNRYVRAHEVYAKHIDPVQQSMINGLIAAGTDLVSLEFYQRFRNKRNLLSQKFQIMFYLSEVRPQYQEIYLSQTRDRLAIVKLVLMTIKSLGRLIKGIWIEKFVIGKSNSTRVI